MKNTTNNTNRNRKATTPPVLLTAIVALKQTGPTTAKDLGVSPANMNRLVKLDLVKVGSTVRTSEGAGRPAHVYSLTKTGRDRATRALKKMETAAEQAEA